MISCWYPSAEHFVLGLFGLFLMDKDKEFLLLGTLRSKRELFNVRSFIEPS